MLENKKTYLCAAGAGLVTIAYAIGLISTETWQILMGLLIPGGIASMRQAVGKVEK